MASVALLLSSAAFLNAQVTMGSQKPPETFSVLEMVSNHHNGMRLPQMTTEERDIMANDAFKANVESQGLQIFNTTTYCIDTWNGYAWISACGPNLVPSPPSIELNTNRVTAFVNAMYDFQHQTITAYLTSGAVATYQWEISTDNGATWFNIVGATSANWVIPADFMYNYAGLEKHDETPGAGNSSIEVFFRCLITDYSGETGHTSDDNLLKMLFVRTNSPGYGILNGVRFLTINRGVGGGTGNGAIKMALLSLGQSGTGAYMNGAPLNNDNDGTLNDAGDLGDFYNWGRVADGHEHVVWSKNSITYVNVIDPPTGNGDTSVPILAPAPTADINAATDQILPSSSYYGKYIYGNSAGAGLFWGTNNNDTWGNGYDTRANAPANLLGWSAKGQGNNPCPSGWYVPSRFDIWDIYRGNGSNDPVDVNVTSTPFVSTADNDNDWTWRAATANAYASVVVTNASGEVLFLPIAGMRSDVSGLWNAGSIGFYWSSTASASGNIVYDLQPYANNRMYAGSSAANNWKAMARSVRCVAQ